MTDPTTKESEKTASWLGRGLARQSAGDIRNITQGSAGAGLPWGLSDMYQTAKRRGGLGDFSSSQLQLLRKGNQFVNANDPEDRWNALRDLSGARSRSQRDFNNLVRRTQKVYERRTGRPMSWDPYTRYAQKSPLSNYWLSGMEKGVLRHAQRTGQAVKPGIPTSSISRLQPMLDKNVRRHNWLRGKARSHIGENKQQYANLGRRLMSVLRRGGDVGALAKEFLGKAFKQFLGTSGGVRSA